MASISIRGLDQKALARLKRQAERQGHSLNALVLGILQGGTGGAPAPRRRRHEDLDSLAGTWSESTAREFGQLTAANGDIDPALWR